MSETQEKKKRKKNSQSIIVETEQIESVLLSELVKSLDELAKQKKHVDIQVCPKCKSPLIRRVNTTSGDMFSHMGWTPPKYECKECGWSGQLVIKATNKPTTVRDVAIIAETKEVMDKTNDNNKRKKRKHTDN
ncbi:MAG: hypothetical protein LBE76_00495 [Nitrososphaerota archaeon]|jgi:RNase P subunit RPR2|nr:hypothetical protein [Nitrososphaerota archaeon]